LVNPSSQPETSDTSFSESEDDAHRQKPSSCTSTRPYGDTMQQSSSLTGDAPVSGDTSLGGDTSSSAHAAPPHAPPHAPQPPIGGATPGTGTLSASVTSSDRPYLLDAATPDQLGHLAAQPPPSNPPPPHLSLSEGSASSGARSVPSTSNSLDNSPSHYRGINADNGQPVEPISESGTPGATETVAGQNPLLPGANQQQQPQPQYPQPQQQRRDSSSSDPTTGQTRPGGS
jgi:hypothetical protein